MRVLFGPDHDGLHIDPTAPDGYEWWYFDALSDDGRFALVAIFFLGAPMSPYYRAVVEQKHPRPIDWCGVFFTLHERVGDRWIERNYAYNLYNSGRFDEKISIGDSQLITKNASWQLEISERGLWGSQNNAALSFVCDAPLRQEPLGESDDNHTWVCVAPQCRVHGTVGDVAFSGEGYHDHNFGTLPWTGVERWYWERQVHQDSVRLRYFTTHTDGTRDDLMVYYEGDKLGHERGDFGELALPDEEKVRTDRKNQLTASVFYIRHADSTGVREIFTPRKMLGPLIRHFIWTRIRRRKSRGESTL